MHLSASCGYTSDAEARRFRLLANLAERELKTKKAAFQRDMGAQKTKAQSKGSENLVSTEKKKAVSGGSF